MRFQVSQYQSAPETKNCARSAQVAQTFAALRPGGHAVWVLKAFVRDGKRVEFPDQWRQLCESVGFKTLHLHRAWLVEDHGTQLAIDGNHKRKRKERKSFFRRMAEFNAQALVWWNEFMPDRNVKARYLREAHRDLWQDYTRRSTEWQEGDDEIPYPTPTRIRSVACGNAYRDTGAPPLDIEMRIDHETVICMVKP